MAGNRTPGGPSAAASRLTAADLRFRFFTALREVDQPPLLQMTQLDHKGTENFLAIDLVTGEIHRNRYASGRPGRPARRGRDCHKARL